MTEVTVMHKMISYGYWDLATDTPTRQYRIIISGRLGVVGREAFRDFRIEPHGTDTALTGDLNRSGLFDPLAQRDRHARLESCLHAPQRSRPEVPLDDRQASPGRQEPVEIRRVLAEPGPPSRPQTG